MRSIFFKLFLSFSLIIVLAGLISGLVMFSLTRRSVESFREDVHQRLQMNIARTVVLVGQSAYVMHKYRSIGEFERYLNEIQDSMQIRIFLCMENTVIPQDSCPQSIIDNLPAAVLRKETPYIQETDKELIVIQRLFAPDGQSYIVMGQHQLQRPLVRRGGAHLLGKPSLRFLAPVPGSGPRLFGRLGPGSQPPEQWTWLHLFRNGPELHTFVFLVIAGIVCFKLAKSFSAPLDRLRKTSREIAAGNLSARVGASLGEPGNEIGDLARDFDHMAERMEGLISSQKRLLLDISHELRSPLTRLNLALELARKHFQTEHDVNLARIAKESDRLNDLIGQLLTLTRIESQETIKETAPVRLDDLLLEISEDLDFEIGGSDKGVQLLNKEPLSVVGSKELLRQAVENIVRNATYYTRPGSKVEISQYATTHDDSGKTTAVIRVRDFGPGVLEEKLPHILEPFFRVAEARDRDKGSTGIGLAIAHQAVKLHGGSIALANAADKQGLIVEIHLPLQEKAF